MNKIRFKIEAGRVPGAHGSAYVNEGENAFEELKEAMWQAVRLDIGVTISGVTMFAAAWEDPEHWAGEWAGKLGVSHEDAPSAVAELIDAATATAGLEPDGAGA